MKKSTLAIASLLVLGITCWAAERFPVRRHFLQNRDVVALAKAGFDQQSIIETMLAQPNRFDTSVPALAALAGEGISERVLEVMVAVKARMVPSTLQSMLVATPAGAVPVELPRAAHDVPYRTPVDIRIDGRCPSGNVSYAVVAGTLPQGLQLTILGLDGTPQEMGEFQFSVRAANECVSMVRRYKLVVDGRPLLEIAPQEIAFTVAEPGQVPASKSILASSTWPNLPYTVDVRNAPWLRATQEHGVTPDPGASITGDVVTLSVDASKLSPGTYHGSVIFWTRHGANAPKVPVVLVVGAPSSKNAPPTTN